jgi:1-acyl-sn-glycerol-3-phosphate acyltransferase
VTYGDPGWAFSRLWLQPITKLFTRARLYGGERLPPNGVGCVLAVNHLHWVDICVVGATSPRTIQYVAKREAFEIPIVGWYIGLHGAIGVRRGESDRDAVRHMRATDGRSGSSSKGRGRSRAGLVWPSRARRWSPSRRTCR